MARTEECAYAWALASAVGANLTPGRQNWMSVALGAGDNTDTIERLLDVVESHAIELGKEIATLTADWLAGYIGTS